MSQKEAIALLRRAERILVSCHRRPDADALGSALGFTAMARALGKEVDLYVPEALPLNLRFLSCKSVLRELPTGKTYDVAFVMDTAARELLPPTLPGPDVRGPLVIIDHHAAHDDVGDVVLRDDNACATAEVLMDLAEALELRPVPPEAATPLYAALVADTGGFRYPSTRARVLRMAAELIDGGAQPWDVAYELFEGWRPERLRLLGAVLDSFEVHFDGRLALMKVSRAMLARCGAEDEMIEGMVNYGRMLRGVEVAALVWEYEGPDGLESKISLRSRGEVDVAAIATTLGGGGHRSAAGATRGESMDEVAVRVCRVVEPTLAAMPRTDASNASE